MDDVILKVENLSKQYRLGLVGTGTLSHDLNRFWHKIRGKENPYLKVGAVNDRSKKASSDYVWALQDINFEVKRGEVLGIIGKNGAGKSTLLKILSRVTAPTTGSIKTKGRIASLLEVGTGMHPELTGRENIFLNGAILGMTKAEIAGKIDEIVEFSGCEMYIDTPVKRYSSGMRVRLGFAVAAFLEPDILVVDEVLAVGDAEFQKKAIGKMQDVSSQGGRTVLFVSHNMTSIRSLCSRVVVLENGGVVFDGDTNTGIERYLESNNESNTNINDKSDFIKSISFIKDNKEVEQICIGDSFQIHVEFKDFQITQKIDYCFIGLEDNDRRVLSLGTHHDVNFNGEIKPNNTLSCKVNNLPLNQGVYRILFAVGTNMPRQNIEVLENVRMIKIINNDFFNNGIDVLKNQGDLIIKSDWSIISNQ
ncbi:ABC transporter ATP-binding protein [Nonlabens tegetincola]|uniref:ABC transporter ATP-binding protein n=1 Tax=Nonlabens tegetincola TaxID=323273 RepID=UPI000A20B669|nr:ABC transporter ATP-binding protein [Nonlabens tegetincola]ARN71588.1 ABC transporter ATP-binding protein [Nonlabens tegetincola]